MSEPDEGIHEGLPGREEEAEAVKGEFAFVSRELHDQVGQDIATSLKLLELHERNWQHQNHGRALANLSEARRMMRRALKITVELAMFVRTRGSRDRPAGAGVTLTLAPPKPADVNSATRRDYEEIFVILREALFNAMTHSAAREITVRLSSGEDRLEATVEDNGTGILPDIGESPTSLGLASMRERTKLLGGTFELTEAVAGGTRVSIIVPLDRAAARLRRVPAAAVAGTGSTSLRHCGLLRGLLHVLRMSDLPGAAPHPCGASFVRLSATGVGHLHFGHIFFPELVMPRRAVTGRG